MSTPDMGSHLSNVNVVRHTAFTDSLEDTQETSATLANRLQANLEASQDKLALEADENSIQGTHIRTKKLLRKPEAKTEKAKRVQDSVLVRKEDADGLADEFAERHGNREYHLNPKMLSQLAEAVGSEIYEETNPDEMLNIIRRRMAVNGKEPDVAIVDKTLDFLLEVAVKQIEKNQGVNRTRLETIRKNIEAAKIKHFEAYGVDIQVAQKIIGAVDAVAHTTGMGVTEILGRYRDVVHNPPDLQSLRKYYEDKGYKAMMLELKGLNSYLGGNFKRTNLETPELGQLASAARKMQALLGVFRQTKIHIPTMLRYLELNHVIEVAKVA